MGVPKRCWGKEQRVQCVGLGVAMLDRARGFESRGKESAKRAMHEGSKFVYTKLLELYAANLQKRPPKSYKGRLQIPRMEIVRIDSRATTRRHLERMAESVRLGREEGAVRREAAG